MKISREGIVLIKSFEGFRPRAIRREQGGWVIGYGHTLSAREGGSVSEADAELLLRYDLMPVEKGINNAGSAVLNQHQFDAIVSFAFSVGIDRFQTSDVLGHLMSGATAQAADALMGWPEPALPQAALRRRAAERALFVADPDADVAVSDLLVAPVPMADAAPVEPVSDEPTPPVAIPVDDSTTIDPRTAAVSALLGEDDAPIVPTFATTPAVFAGQSASAADDTPPPANDAIAADHAGTADAATDDETGAPTETIEHETSAVAVDQDEPTQPETLSEPEPADVQQLVDAADFTPSAAIGMATPSHRYTPYNAAMVGPLPFLQPLPAAVADAQPAPEPEITPEGTAQTVEVAVVAEQPFESAPIQSFAPAAEVEPLVLSVFEDAPTPALTRQPWTIEERADAVEPADGGLFGEDLSLTQGGAPVMRHGDVELQAPASFDWSETGAFIIMGAVGLTAFGAAMAAFRLASEQSGGDQTVIIAWVLAVIGAACVGVSSFNLYRRWGLPGGDN